MSYTLPVVKQLGGGRSGRLTKHRAVRLERNQRHRQPVQQRLTQTVLEKLILYFTSGSGFTLSASTAKTDRKYD